MDSVKSLFAASAHRTVKATFGENGTSITFEAIARSKGELEAAAKQFNRPVKDNTRDGGGRMTTRLDRPAMRSWLYDQLVQVEGMTVGKVFELCNRVAPADDAGRPIVWDQADAGCRDTLMILFEHARTKVDGEIIGFEDFVWNQVASVADEQHATEAGEKNA